MPVRSFVCCLSLLICALSPAVSWGKEWHVSPQGSDQAEGSADAPLLTVQRGCDLAAPGDTILVAKGTYTGGITFPTSGTAAAPITLKAMDGAVLSAKGLKVENVVLIQDRDFIKVIGFEITSLKARDGSGIRILGSGQGIELRKNRIHEIRGTDAMGITVYGTNPEVPVKDLVIAENEIFDCDPAKSEALTLNGNIDGFQIISNSVHDVNNIGIDMIGGESGTVGVARNGVCSGNSVARCRSKYGDGYAAGIYVDGGKNIIVENNRVTQCDLGIEIGAENKGTEASGIHVRGNLIYHNDKAGIVFGGYDKSTGRVRNCEFTGNTCYQNNRHKRDHNGELWIQWAENNVVSGNNFVVNGSDSPLVTVEKGAGANSVSGNRYFTDAGEDDAFFYYHERDVNGFAAWRRASGWDADSTFGQVTIKLPE